MKYRITKELIWLVEAENEDEARRKAHIYGDFTLGTVKVENLSEETKKETKKDKKKK